MIRTRWLKVLRDLWGNRGRTFTVTIALAVGVYALGVIMDARELLAREYALDRASVLKSSVVITTLPFDDDLTERIEEIPGVMVSEGRTTIRSQVTLSNGERKELKLESVPDFSKIKVDRFTHLEGNWPPQKNEVLLERLGSPYLEVNLGDPLNIELEGKNLKIIQVGGVVHDPLQYTPRLNNTTKGYVTREGMRNLGYSDQFNEMHIRLDEEITEDEEIQIVVDQIKKQIENSGRVILKTDIAIDNPVDSIMDTVILMLTIMGWLIFLLSGFLVINAISALVTQQIQQIGIMKLVGASRAQIFGMYLVTLLFYGSISACIGIPLASLTAQLLITELIQDLINIIPDSLMIPPHIIVFQVAIALLLPLIAGLIPVLRGTRLTTKEALNDSGIKSEKNVPGIFERGLSHLQKLRPLKRTYLLAARNALRHKGRLAQTLFVLILGTALFISVISVNSSINATLVNFLHYHQYDVSVEMSRLYRVEKLEAIAHQIPMVKKVESWTISSAQRIRENNQESNFYRLYAVPIDSEIIDPQLIEGRWLNGKEKNEIVINSDVFDEEKELIIGDFLKLDIHGYEVTGQLVGIVRTDSQGPSVYILRSDYMDITNTRGRASHVQIVASSEGQDKQDRRRSAG